MELRNNLVKKRRESNLTVRQCVNICNAYKIKVSIDEWSCFETDRSEIHKHESDKFKKCLAVISGNYV